MRLSACAAFKVPGREVWVVEPKIIDETETFKTTVENFQSTLEQ
jgi:hypothetical protein